MRRFEQTEKGPGKFWEIAVEGTRLVTRWGKIGTAGQEKTKTLPDPEKAQAEMVRLVQEKLARGYAEASPESAGAPAESGRKAGKSTLPTKPSGFLGITDRSLKALATKIARLDNSDRIGNAIGKAIDDYDQRGSLAWHLAMAGYLPDVASHEALLEFMATEELDEERATFLAALLAQRKGEGDGRRLVWLPNWTLPLDEMVYEALPLAPQAFAEQEPSYPEQMKLGLAFVRGRRGEKLPAETSRRVLEAFVTEAGSGGAGNLNVDLRYFDDAGKEVELSMDGLAAVKTLALRFGSLEDWAGVSVAVAKKNQWLAIEEVQEALQKLPYVDLNKVFATRESSLFGASSTGYATAMAIMLSRADDPEQLLAKPKVVPEAEQDASLLRELYAVAAIHRLHALGKPIPDAADALLGDFHLLRYPEIADQVLDALRALPADRVHALVRERLPVKSSAIGALGAHFDAALLSDFLAGDTFVGPEVLALVGAPGLPALIASAHACSKERSVDRGDAVLLAMQRLVKGGAVPDESWDAELDMRRKSASGREARRAVIAALPPERRDRFILSELAGGPATALSLLPLASAQATVDEGIRRALSAKVVDTTAIRKLGARAHGPLVAHARACEGDAEVLSDLECCLPEQVFDQVKAALS